MGDPSTIPPLAPYNRSNGKGWILGHLSTIPEAMSKISAFFDLFVSSDPVTIITTDPTEKKVTCWSSESFKLYIDKENASPKISMESNLALKPSLVVES